MNLTKQPETLSAIHNEILFSFFKPGYTAGDLFFLEVWRSASDMVRRTANAADKVGAVLLDTLVKNGDGLGNVTFDVSQIVKAALPAPAPAPAVPVRLVASDPVPIEGGEVLRTRTISAVRGTPGITREAPAAYFIKAGYISYPGGVEFREYRYESRVFYAARFARPKDNITTAPYVANNRKLLTSAPATRETTISTTQYVSFALLNNGQSSTLSLKAKLQYIDGTEEETTVRSLTNTTGGIFTFGFLPARDLSAAKMAALQAFELWIDEVGVYASAEISEPVQRNNCSAGYTGSVVTYTLPAGSFTSLISQPDADQKARTHYNANKQAYANANGICYISGTLYSSAAISEEVQKNDCTGGLVGSRVLYTVAAGSFTSYDSQADANQKARAHFDATKQAYANTNGTCGVAFYNVEITEPVSRDNCGNGYAGSTINYTVEAGTFSSSISQADADLQARTHFDATKQAYANQYGACILIPRVQIFDTDYKTDTTTSGTATTRIDTSDYYIGFKDVNGNAVDVVNMKINYRVNRTTNGDDTSYGLSRVITSNGGVYLLEQKFVILYQFDEQQYNEYETSDISLELADNGEYVITQ